MQGKKGKAQKDHVKLGTVRTEGSSIVNFRAQSMTLFHELFHVVLGVERTMEHDRSCKYALWPSILEVLID
jgi:Zn-dependent peptidase ImmA (M78 family)